MTLHRRTILAAGLAMPFVSTRARADLPEIPPIPEIGRAFVTGSRASEATMWRAIGLTAGPQ